MSKQEQQYSAEQINLATYTIVTPYESPMQCCIDKLARCSETKRRRILKLMDKAERLSGQVFMKYPTVDDAAEIHRKMKHGHQGLGMDTMQVGSEAMEKMSLEEGVQHGSIPTEASDSVLYEADPRDLGHANAYGDQGNHGDLVDRIMKKCNMLAESAAWHNPGQHDTGQHDTGQHDTGQHDTVKYEAKTERGMSMAQINTRKGMTSFKLQSHYPVARK